MTRKLFAYLLLPVMLLIPMTQFVDLRTSAMPVLPATDTHDRMLTDMMMPYLNADGSTVTVTVSQKLGAGSPVPVASSQWTESCSETFRFLDPEAFSSSATASVSGDAVADADDFERTWASAPTSYRHDYVLRGGELTSERNWPTSAWLLELAFRTAGSAGMRSMLTELPYEYMFRNPGEYHKMHDQGIFLAHASNRYLPQGFTTHQSVARFSDGFRMVTDVQEDQLTFTWTTEAGLALGGIRFERTAAPAGCR